MFNVEGSVFWGLVNLTLRSEWGQAYRLSTWDSRVDIFWDGCKATLVASDEAYHLEREAEEMWLLEELRDA